MLGRIGAIYGKALVRTPVLTKSITSAVISCGGDFFCQKVIERNNTDGLDRNRLIKFTLLGFCVLGPTLHTWFGILGRQIPGKTFKDALKRTAIDQIFFAPFMISLILSSLSFIESVQRRQMNIYENLKRDLKERYFETFLMNYVFWTPTQFLNFYFIPLRYQVLFNNFVSFFWSCYLSFSASRAKAKRIPIPTKDTDEDNDIELS